MEVKIFGKFGDAVLKLRLFTEKLTTHKLSSGDLRKYMIQLNKSRYREEFKNFRYCYVADKRPAEWRGYHSDLQGNVDAGGISSEWRGKSSIARVQSLGAALGKKGGGGDGEEEDGGNGGLLHNFHLGIRYFGSNGNIDFALMEPVEGKLSNLGFCLGQQEIRKAGRGIFSAINKLHSMNIVHANISTDSILYDCVRDEFLLTDLFCTCSTFDFSSLLYGDNPLYHWVRHLLHGVNKSSAMYKSISMVGDFAAVVSVMKYMATMDKFMLLQADPLLLKCQGEEDKSLPKQGTSRNKLTIVRMTEMYLSGEKDLMDTMMWISQLQGVVPNREAAEEWLQLEGVFSSSESSRMSAFIHKVQQDEIKVPTTLKYRDHPSFAIKMDDKLQAEVTEDRYSHNLRRRLALINYVNVGESIMRDNSYYLPKSDAACFYNISVASSDVERLQSIDRTVM